MSFLEELKRRRVVRFALVDAATAAPDGPMTVMFRPGADPALSTPATLWQDPPTSGLLITVEPTADGGFALRVRDGEPPSHTLVLEWTKLLERAEWPR